MNREKEGRAEGEGKKESEIIFRIWRKCHMQTHPDSRLYYRKQTNKFIRIDFGPCSDQTVRRCFFAILCELVDMVNIPIVHFYPRTQSWPSRCKVLCLCLVWDQPLCSCNGDVLWNCRLGWHAGRERGEYGNMNKKENEWVEWEMKAGSTGLGRIG